jgi:lipoprotein-anchoring transpeptidase ErfK/SrfK
MKRFTLLFLGLIIGLAHAPLFFDTPRAKGQVVCNVTAEFIDTNGGVIALAERYFNNLTLQAMHDDNETLDIILNPTQGCIGKNLAVLIQSTNANDGSGWVSTGTQVSFSVPNNSLLQFKIPYLPGNTDCTTGTTCFYRIAVFEGSTIVGTSISDGTILNLSSGTAQNGKFIATPRANTDTNFSNPSYTQRIDRVIDNTNNASIASNPTNQTPPTPPTNQPNNTGTNVTVNNNPQLPPSLNATENIACDSLPQTEQASCYELLAPIPGFGDSVNTDSLGEYINIVFQIGLGIAGVLAILMIIYAGVKYMTTDAASAKSEGKKLITNAFFGLGVILSAFIFLNTINPDLLNLEPTIDEIRIQVQEENFASTELSIATVSGYKTCRDTPQEQHCTRPQYAVQIIPGSAVPSGIAGYPALEYLRDQVINQTITLEKIQVDVITKRARFAFKNNSTGNSIAAIVRINIGLESPGYAQEGAGTVGDNKTPIGTFIINSDRRIPNPMDGTVAAQTINPPGTNLGAAFINIGVPVPGDSSSNRGIGFHGHANNTLGTTNGCVRMSNDALQILAPIMREGLEVKIATFL